MEIAATKENFLECMLALATKPEGPLGGELNQVLHQVYNNVLINFREALRQVINSAGSSVCAIINSIDNWAQTQLKSVSTETA